MTRWLITGASGMLGTDLVALLTAAGEPVISRGRGGLDIADGTAVREAIAVARADVVVNCAAWTAVDDAEAHEDEAPAVNGHAGREPRYRLRRRRCGPTSPGRSLPHPGGAPFTQREW
jgi:dTDP-4-dehydrorhamnose reductase